MVEVCDKLVDGKMRYVIVSQVTVECFIVLLNSIINQYESHIIQIILINIIQCLASYVAKWFGNAFHIK